MKVRLRAAGAADFEVELEATATTLDAKIAATAGCDLDPQAMRIIFKGRVLKDEDVLSACGVVSCADLHIARGPKPGAAAAVAAPAAAAATSCSASATGSTAAASAGSMTLTIKGPGGTTALVPNIEEELSGLRAEQKVEEIRALAAKRCCLRPEEVHLVHKAKMLKDGSTLAESKVASGDVLRVARRQVGPAPGPKPVAVPEFTDTSGPMPMAWGGGSSGLPPEMQEQMQLAARAMGVPLEEMLAATGIPLEQMAAAARAAPRRPGQPAPGETAVEMQYRFDREARDMAARVAHYLANERARAAAADPRGEDGQAPVVGADEDLEEEDPELLADIAGVLADARSRGAPVPNAAVFVDRAVARRREARALQARLDREAQGMDADLEDAFLAAQQVAEAAEKAPRRLGHGPGVQPPPGSGS